MVSSHCRAERGSARLCRPCHDAGSVERQGRKSPYVQMLYATGRSLTRAGARVRGGAPGVGPICWCFLTYMPLIVAAAAGDWDEHDRIERMAAELSIDNQHMRASHFGPHPDVAQPARLHRGGLLRRYFLAAIARVGHARSGAADARASDRARRRSVRPYGRGVVQRVSLGHQSIPNWLRVAGGLRPLPVTTP